MKCLNITVLFYESIPARIYLALLHKNGYYPKKIVYFKFNRSKKYTFFKAILGEKILNYLLERKHSKNIDTRLANLFLQKFALNYDDLMKDISTYHGIFETLDITNLEDEKLIKYIQTEQDKTFLFTGGGILKERLLSIKDTKFIHIHPGVVPDVKGADGMFWSYLLKNKVGYSCFYMNSGIDTGDIVQINEYKLHKFNNVDFTKFDDDKLYKYLLQYYDPCFRVQTLVNLIEKSDNDLSKFSYEKQNPKDGRTYFFMHEKLRNFTIGKMIKEMNAS